MLCTADVTSAGAAKICLKRVAPAILQVRICFCHNVHDVVVDGRLRFSCVGCPFCVRLGGWLPNRPGRATGSMQRRQIRMRFTATLLPWQTMLPSCFPLSHFQD